MEVERSMFGNMFLFWLLHRRRDRNLGYSLLHGLHKDSLEQQMYGNDTYLRNLLRVSDLLLCSSVNTKYVLLMLKH